MRDGGGRLTLRIFKSLKPVIAACNGAAVGVGVTMQLPMDIRIASENARYGFVFARRGIVPEAASTWFLPRVVGIAQALEWTYSGRVFSGAGSAGRAARQQGRAAGRAVADGAGDCARNRREHVAGVDRADAADDVAAARRRRSDGGPQARQPRRLLARAVAGLRRREHARSSRSARRNSRARCRRTCRRTSRGGRRGSTSDSTARANAPSPLVGEGSKMPALHSVGEGC